MVSGGNQRPDKGARLSRAYRLDQITPQNDVDGPWKRAAWNFFRELPVLHHQPVGEDWLVFKKPPAVRVAAQRPIEWSAE